MFAQFKCQPRNGEKIEKSSRNSVLAHPNWRKSHKTVLHSCVRAVLDRRRPWLFSGTRAVAEWRAERGRPCLSCGRDGCTTILWQWCWPCAMAGLTRTSRAGAPTKSKTRFRPAKASPQARPNPQGGSRGRSPRSKRLRACRNPMPAGRPRSWRVRSPKICRTPRARRPRSQASKLRYARRR